MTSWADLATKARLGERSGWATAAVVGRRATESDLGGCAPAANSPEWLVGGAELGREGGMIEEMMAFFRIKNENEREREKMKKKGSRGKKNYIG